ncbi:MAG: ABC transporter substrate-binding protein [Gammaproteobacteria bacterium]|nr:ABC transporter substrate-binding protein [Gammaproteobacteria bacterium]
MFRNSKKVILFVCICGSLFFNSATQADVLRVGFLCPKPPGQGFWGQVIQVMQAAAADLEIELRVKCDESGSSFGNKRAGERLLNSEPKLDFLLTGYWAAVTKYHLAIAQERGIKVFVFNADIRDDEQNEVGGPRGKYDNWIGHMVPDDQAAAMEMTKILIDRAANEKKKTANNPVNVYAFLGTGQSPIARKRIAGLHEHGKLTPNAKLHEVSMTIVDRRTKIVKNDGAREWAKKIISESLEIDVIWTNNQDEMWGAVQGIEQAGKIPGKDIFVGGFDWDPDSILAIADGRISVSMFGHFLEGAWALILAHDYYYGFDFKDDTGVSISTPIVAMTPENISQYEKILDKDFWAKVDFRKFSKKYNPELESYNFSISQFLDYSENGESKP